MIRSSLIPMVWLFVIVAVFLGVKIYESTTSEYKRTQQALIIGFSGMDGEGSVVWWMVGHGGGLVV